MESVKRKKILFLIPELCVGGAQQAMANITMALAPFYEILVVVFNKQDITDYPLGGSLHSLEVFTGNSWLQKFLALRRRVARLKVLKAEWGADCSISFLEGADYVNVLSRKNDRILISVRGSKFHDRQISGLLGRIRLGLLMPWLYRKADQIVCVSDGVRKELQFQMKLPTAQLTTIYNFIEADNSAALPQIPFQFIVGVGRLHIQKNMEALIRIFDRARRTAHGLRLVIVGDGPLRGQLESLATGLNLRTGRGIPKDGDAPADVYFTGFQNPWPYLRQAKVFLLTSSWEGFPNSLLEAMMAGTPVMAADCETGPREILGASDPVSESSFTDSGVLLPVPDNEQHYQSWADALNQLLTTDNSHRIERARNRASSFSKERAIAQWIKVIEG